MIPYCLSRIVRLTVLSLAASVTSAYATVTLSSSLTAPTANLITGSEKTTPADGTSALGVRWDTSSSSHRDVLQVFTTTADASLGSFTFKLNNQTTPAGLLNAGYTINIYQVASASSFPGSSDVPLATDTGTWTLPTGTAALSYITFSLANSVALTANTSYAFSIGFNSSGAGRNFLISNNGGDDGFHSGGVAASATYTYDPVVAGTPGAWTTFSTDYVFYANATAVPEPSATAAWMAGIAVMFGGFRRSRSRRVG
jgi:hypothetical protein